jgi:hypothetical protein
MAEITQLTALLMGTALFLHLLVIPDYVAYYNAASFPFNNIRATLFSQESSGGPFVLNGTTSCNSVSSCLLQICASPIMVNSDNYLCLQTSKPSLESSMASCEPAHPYTWIFLFYMFLVFLEVGALLTWFWIYRSPYAARATSLLKPELATKILFIASLVMFALSLVVSIFLMTGAGQSAVAVLVMIVVRGTGCAIITYTLYLNWMNELHQHVVQVPSYKETDQGVSSDSSEESKI